MIYDGDYFVGSALNGDSLSHHGVPNQKWGVRNGPPYPVKRGSDTHYNVGKMTAKTKAGLEKSGKIAKNGVKAVKKASKAAGETVISSFKKWKEAKKADLATRDTKSMLVKNWQKKQLRISDMTNQELQQRIDRRKLEEMYRHALRGDFSDPKNWSKGGKGSDGKKAADSILRKFGSAAIEGLAGGISSRINYGITTRHKGRVDRRETRRNAMSNVAVDAAKERAKYKAQQKNADWKRDQERKREQRRNRSRDDGAMDPIGGWTRTRTRPSSGRGLPGSSGRPGGSYYYANPGDWTIH